MLLWQRSLLLSEVLYEKTLLVNLLNSWLFISFKVDLERSWIFDDSHCYNSPFFQITAEKSISLIVSIYIFPPLVVQLFVSYISGWQLSCDLGWLAFPEPGTWVSDQVEVNPQSIAGGSPKVIMGKWSYIGVSTSLMGILHPLEKLKSGIRKLSQLYRFIWAKLRMCQFRKLMYMSIYRSKYPSRMFLGAMELFFCSGSASCVNPNSMNACIEIKN